MLQFNRYSELMGTIGALYSSRLPSKLWTIQKTVTAVDEDVAAFMMQQAQLKVEVPLAVFAAESNLL